MTDDASPSLTIIEFCAAEKISRAKLHLDWADGRGPRFYYNGSHRRITAAARHEWQLAREDEAAAAPRAEPKALQDARAKPKALQPA